MTKTDPLLTKDQLERISYERARTILRHRSKLLAARVPPSGDSETKPADPARRQRRLREWGVAGGLGAIGSGVAAILIREPNVSTPIVVSAWVVVLFGIWANNQTYVRARRQHARDESTRMDYEAHSLPDHKLAIVRVEKLLERLDRQQRLLTQNVLRNVFFGLLLAFPLLGAAVVLANSKALLQAAILVGMFEALTSVLFVSTRNRARQLESGVQQADYELNLLMSDLSSEQRAERLYLKQQFELKRYYDEALRQSSSLSYIGAGCVVGGFVIVGVTFALLTGEDTPTTIIATAVVGGVGGVLANFVAVVFLQMHSGTIRALTAFHERLVSTNHMHLAHLMVSRIGVDGVPSAQSIALDNLAPHVARSGEPLAADNGRQPTGR